MKKILFTLCLAAALTGARGQIYIDSYRFGAAAEQLLLDEYPNALAAYSFRLIDENYSGNCVRIRRVNGDTTNISFVSNYIDTAEIKTFCGTSSTDTCWVTTWYDQSGNARDAVQGVNNNQPRILTAGNLLYKNGKIKLFFDGVNDFMLMPRIAPHSIFLVVDSVQRRADFQRIVHTSQTQTGALSGSNASFLINSTSGSDVLYTATAAEDTFALTTQSFAQNHLLLSGLPNPNRGFPLQHENGVQKTSVSIGAVPVVITPTYIGIGARVSGNGTQQLGQYFRGDYQEMIFWSDDKNSSRTGIQTNINTFYSIY